jgi:phosphoribosylformylglycinamidine cyclo-ligase
MDDGRIYGESLLDPSVIYVKFIAACQTAGLRLHYAAHVTGHGWRKLMRLNEPFVYRIMQPGWPQKVFHFIQKNGPVEPHEAYATFNMGVGFAAYVAPEDADRCTEIAQATGYQAWVAGSVLKQGNRKAVEIAPLGITFEAETLQVR